MTHHHSQVVEMAELASARAESAEVKDLAERIAAAQAREVEQMAAWLEDWGEPGEADGMDGLMPGDSVRMTDDDMSALEASNRPEIDVMFSALMILPHCCALARTEKR